MKKETLEQIAEKYSQRSTAPVFQEAHKQDFIAGAKWQQEQSKEMEEQQIGYSEEDVREMLFMALNEPQEECCTTHTKDSIVRKVLKTFNQLRLAEQLENEIDNL